MNKRMFGAVALAAVCVVVLLAPPLSRADDGPVEMAEAPAPTLGDLAWLTGSWLRETETERAEEMWSPGANGAMMGLFRWVAGGELIVYEMLVIREREAGGLEMLLRHFSDDLTSWETRPLVFEVAVAGAQRVVFTFDGDKDHSDPVRIEYSREGETKRAHVKIGSGERLNEFELVYTRQNR